MITFREFLLREENDSAVRSDVSPRNGLYSKSADRAVKSLSSPKALEKAEEIKNFLTEENNPFFDNKGLKIVSIVYENPPGFSFVSPDETRESIRKFFSKYGKNNEYTSIFYNLFIALRNYVILKTDEEREIVKKYIPDRVASSERAMEENSILLVESLKDYSYKSMTEGKGKQVPAYTYCIREFFDGRNLEEKKKRYVQTIIKSDPDKNVYYGGTPEVITTSSNKSTHKTFFMSQEHDQEPDESEEEESGERESEKKETPKMSPNIKNVGKEDEKESKKETPKSKNSEPDTPETEQDDEGAGNEPEGAETEAPEEEPKEDPEKDLFSGLVASKNYGGKSLKEVVSEYEKIKEFLNIVNSRSLLDLFTDGGTLGGKLHKYSNPLSTSLKAIERKVGEGFTEYTEKDRKEDKREIRDVKRAGSALGGAYLKLKTQKGLERTGKRVRASAPKVNLEESIRGYFKIEKSINSIRKELEDLYNASNKSVVRTGVNEKLTEVSDKIIKYAERVILHYRKENRKYEKDLSKRIGDIRNEDKVIRNFDEPTYVRNLGYSLNNIKGNLRNLINDLNRFLKLYEDIASVTTYKSQKEKERLEKIKSSEHDYKKLERKAFNRYREEKLSRQGAEDSKKMIKTLEGIKEFSEHKKKEGFGKIKMFNDFDKNLDKSLNDLNFELANKVIEKYDEIKYLSPKELNDRSDTLTKAEEELRRLKNSDTEVGKRTYGDLLSRYQSYINNPSEKSYQDLEKKAGVVEFPKTDDEIYDVSSGKEKLKSKREDIKKEPEKTIDPQNVKKDIGLIKRMAERFRASSEKRKVDISKVASESARIDKMIRGKHRTQQTQAPIQDAQGRATLYFKEDVNTVSTVSANLFEPFKKVNDNIVVFTNRASSAKSIEEIDDALNRVRRIISSTNRPSIIVPSYSDRIISNIDTILDKIETLLDTGKADPKIVERCSKVISMLINYLDYASSNLRNQLMAEIRKGGTPVQRPSAPDENIPQGVKPAITTKKIGNEEEEESEETEDDEEKEELPEKKNLLALAREKIKAGK